MSPLEGKINSFKFNHNTIITDDHPAVMQSRIIDDSVTEKQEAGTILKTMTGDNGAKYGVCEESDTPAAVLLEDFDPKEQKKYAMCLFHGTIKKEYLKIKGQKATLAMLDKLQLVGIFSV